MEYLNTIHINIRDIQLKRTYSNMITPSKQPALEKSVTTIPVGWISSTITVRHRYLQFFFEDIFNIVFEVRITYRQNIIEVSQNIEFV